MKKPVYPDLVINTGVEGEDLETFIERLYSFVKIKMKDSVLVKH